MKITSNMNYNKAQKELKKFMDKNTNDEELKNELTNELLSILEKTKQYTNRIKEMKKILKKPHSEEVENEISEEYAKMQQEMIEIGDRGKDISKKLEELRDKAKKYMVLLTPGQAAVIEANGLDAKTVRKQIIKLIKNKNIECLPYEIADRIVVAFHLTLMEMKKGCIFGEEEYDSSEFSMESKNNPKCGLRGNVVLVDSYNGYDPVLFDLKTASSIVDDMGKNGPKYIEKYNDMSVEDDIRYMEIGSGEIMSEEDKEIYKAVSEAFMEARNNE